MSSYKGDKLSHSQTAVKVIIQSLLIDFDLTFHKLEESSLPIQKISYIYVHAVVVFHILVVQFDAI
jgi:hypothetical protein